MQPSTLAYLALTVHLMAIHVIVAAGTAPSGPSDPLFGWIWPLITGAWNDLKDHAWLFFAVFAVIWAWQKWITKNEESGKWLVAALVISFLLAFGQTLYTTVTSGISI